MIDPHSIREATILDGLTPSEIQEIADIAREEHFQKGARLFSRGDKANTFYIVESGRINVAGINRANVDRLCDAVAAV